MEFKPKKPIKFRSGIVSPVYCDNRKFLFYPEEWKKVIKEFKHLIERDKIDFYVIAGAKLGDAPHASALSFALSKPLVAARKQSKDCGLGKIIESGDITNKKILIVEDLLTTGHTSILTIENLRR